jgi:uncharacterized protein (DUF1499 family)
MVVIKPVMGRRHAARKWLIRLTWVVMVVAPLIFIVAGLGAKVGLWDWRFGLGTLTRNIGPKALMLSGVLGILSLIAALLIQPRKRRGIFTGAAAILVALLGLMQLKGVQDKAAELPFIHDVTTDTQDPPAFAGKILEERAAVKGVNTLDYVGKTDSRENKLVSVLQTRSYPQIRPVITSDSPEVAFGRAEQIAQDLGWAIKDMDAVSGVIEATDTTFWYGFQDDVVIRIRPGAGGGAVVDVRSVSRVGGSDLGANADRISAFIEAFKS